jgi:hypothetical protein
MSGKLDQSLDEILTTRRRSGPRGGRAGGRAGAGARGRVVSAPVGGVKKATKATPARATKPVVPTGPAGGESKVIVSGLVSHLHHGVIQYQCSNYYSPSMSTKRNLRYVEQQAIEPSTFKHIRCVRSLSPFAYTYIHSCLAWSVTLRTSPTALRMLASLRHDAELAEVEQVYSHLYNSFSLLSASKDHKTQDVPAQRIDKGLLTQKTWLVAV